MTLRELTVAILRILAIAMLCWASMLFATLVVGIAQYFMLAGITPTQWNPAVAGVIAQCVTCFSYAVVGIALFLLAPRLAQLVVRDEPLNQSQVDISTIRPGHLYQIAAFLLGCVLVTKGMADALSHVHYLIRRPSGVGGMYSTPMIVAGIVYAIGGCFLMFGAGKLADFLGRFRYDPDQLPSQQMSVRLILAVVVLGAILLGVIRLISQW
jgi:hypothetical protein